MTESSQLLVQILKKLSRSQIFKNAYRNKKLDTILNQFKALENSQQSNCNIHNGFQSLASIIIEMLDNIQKYQSSYNLREETMKDAKKR